MTSEMEFLAQYDPTAFDRPSVAVDVAIVTAVEGVLKVLMVQRTSHPHQGRWQLPGGFVHMSEPLDDAARRVLKDKASVEDVYLEQLYTFGDPNRDPRARVISVAYYALMCPSRLDWDTLSGKFHAVRVPWLGEGHGGVDIEGPHGMLPIAFDHSRIVAMIIRRLRGKLDYAPIAYSLLPDEFTLLELQAAHETILGHPVNKDSFRRRLLASGDLVPTGRCRENVGFRPPALYRYGGDL